MMKWATAVRLEKNVTDKERTANRKQTDRESNYRGHSNPVDHRVEWANIDYSPLLLTPAKDPFGPTEGICPKYLLIDWLYIQL